jgi:hypothetical protein
MFFAILGYSICMYCPKCAAPNSDDVRFCRVCGENLTVIAQAMSRHLPVMLVSKLDDYLERKHERLRRDSVLTGLSGLFLLLSGIWQVTHAGGWPAAFMLLGALILFLVSTWDLLAYKRSRLRKAQDAGLLPAAKPDGLTANTPQIQPTSVTEQTTRFLETTENRSTRET